MQLKKKISAICNIRCCFDQENMHLSSKGFRQVFMFSVFSALWKLYLVPTALLCAANMMIFFHSKSLLGVYTHPSDQNEGHLQIDLPNEQADYTCRKLNVGMNRCKEMLRECKLIC